MIVKFFRVFAVLALGLALAGLAGAQTTPTPNPTQYFVASTTAGSFGGNAVAIASLGAQIVGQPTTAVSLTSEFISNPNDSSKPHIGSGLVDVTKPASSFLPAAIKSKLLIDFSNYNLTFQAGAGVESLSNGVSLPRTKHIVGNFGIYGSYPLPGGHTQVGIGYKWIVGPGGGTVKVPMGNLSFTF